MENHIENITDIKMSAFKAVHQEEKNSLLCAGQKSWRHDHYHHFT